MTTTIDGGDDARTKTAQHHATSNEEVIGTATAATATAATLNKREYLSR